MRQAIVILTALLCHTAWQQTTPVPFNNIDYILSGYNIFKGNPLSFNGQGGTSTLDPGYSGRIFAADYSAQITTADLRYYMPKGYSILASPQCSFSTTSKTIDGETSYTNELKLRVKSEVSYGLGAFTASSSYNIMKEEFNSQGLRYTATSATCLAYKAIRNSDNPPPLHNDFVTRIKSLPAAYDATVYAGFFEDYGTHYTKSGELGAKYSLFDSLTESAWSTLVREGINVELGASYSSRWTLAGSLATEEERQIATKYRNSRFSSRLSTLGSAPPTDGNLQTWASNSKIEPMTISLVLAPISDLLTTANFPTVSNIVTIKANVERAFNEYCNFLASIGSPVSCQYLTPDRIFDLTESSYYLQPKNFPDFRMSYNIFEQVWLGPYNTENALYMRSITWKVSKSDCPGSSIALESHYWPGYFARHSSYLLYLHQRDGSNLFKGDSCFIPRVGLAGAEGISFESVNFPGHFIRHTSWRLRISPWEDTEVFKNDATWILIKNNQFDASDIVNVILGDFNGDGKTDFIKQEKRQVAINDFIRTASLFLSRGDGNFNRILLDESFNLNGEAGCNIIPGDFNGDGKMDFIRQEKGGWDDDEFNSANVFLSNGDGSFKITNLPESYEIRFDPGAILHIGDFNGDGKADFLRQEKGSWDNDNTNTANIFFSNGDGTFDRRDMPSYMNLQYDEGVNLFIGDFNGDGKSDFLRQEKGWWSNDIFYTGRIFISKIDANKNIHFDEWPLPENWSLDGDLTKLYIAKFNGDNKSDILRQKLDGDSRSETCWLFLSNANDNEYVKKELSEDFNLSYNKGVNILVGDFDGDGKTDFLRQERAEYDNDRENTARVFISNGDGTFNDRDLPESFKLNADFPLTGMKVAVHIGDFNGDGRADILRQEIGKEAFEIFLANAGGMTFRTTPRSASYA